MRSRTFKSFVKQAIAVQVADEDTPPDYVETRAAIMARYPELQKYASSGSAAGDIAELVGLGTLAAPAVQHLRGKEMSEKNKARAEVAGLGILAAPYAHSLANKNKTYSRAYGAAKSGIGRAAKAVASKFRG